MVLAQFLASSTTLPKPSHSKGHAGPIAGGIVGGAFIIGVIAAAIFYPRWRKQRRGVNASEALIPDFGTDRPDRTVAEGLVLMSEDETDRVAASSTLGSTVTGPQPMMVMPVKLYVCDFMSHAATNVVLMRHLLTISIHLEPR